MSEDFNLFAELTKLPRPHVVVDFPALNEDGTPVCQIALTVLNNYELQDVKADAHRHVNKLLKDDLPTKDQYSPGFVSLYEDAVATEILYRSCKNPEDLGKRFFPSKQSVNVCTPDQLGILVNHYNMLVATKGPVVTHMSSEEMDDLCKRIADAGKDGAFFLNSLSLEEQRAFTTYLAVRLSSSLTDNESPTSPPEEK